MIEFPPGKPARAFDVSDGASNCRRNEDDYQQAPVGRDKFRPFARPDDATLTYLYKLKRVMQAFTTQVEDFHPSDYGAVLEKSFSEIKRNKQKEPKKKLRKQQQQGPQIQTNEGDDDDTKEASTSTKRFLRRKRFHNFSPNVLAHDFLSYRRLDRIYHRCTLRLKTTAEEEFFSESDSQLVKNRPFLVFSLTGDMFLYQQARRVIGLLIAILRGCIDIEILDCIFDEEVCTNFFCCTCFLRFNLTSL
jgi:tRNA U38,U39,U40 pseudouridine synthase TruA